MGQILSTTFTPEVKTVSRLPLVPRDGSSCSTSPCSAHSHLKGIEVLVRSSFGSDPGRCRVQRVQDTLLDWGIFASAVRARAVAERRGSDTFLQVKEVKESLCKSGAETRQGGYPTSPTQFVFFG